MIFRVICLIFVILDSDPEKVAFHKSSYPKESNLNIDCTDYACEISPVKILFETILPPLLPK